ncbi:serine/threonine kinase 16 [Rhizodiscina lignyota]|uniref:Serine/threonine kinase 16 n=1 Tax=Rhizodiscina lignyota TaxID=1504668 RepID=A0A9P4IDA4_9PEZI|nr:serine/threonine kinase 16 [Rhizodiscina lignyota]
MRRSVPAFSLFGPNLTNKFIQELKALEAELGTELLPGTEIMRDVGTHHFVKGRKGSSEVLVPQPTDDPADPLNWSLMWKIITIFTVSFVTFAQAFGTLSLAPQFPYYIEEFHSTLPDVVQFTGVTILVLGFSNFVWVPLSTSFGRRPVLLVSTAICLGASIWKGTATSYNSFMGACALNGIGAGPTETIQPAVIADMFFLHDRGKWNTAYWVTYMGSLMVSPIVAGPMAEQVGFRSFWWLNVALLGATIVLIVFGYPETRWHRLHPSEIQRQEALRLAESVSIENATTEHDPEKPSTEHDPKHDSATTAARDPYLGKGKPKKLQWALFQPNAHPFQSMLIDFWTPWKLFVFPIVEFASFVVSWSCSSFLTLNLTQSQAFAAPPYNFSASSVGFTNFAVVVGAIIGLATGGPFSDWVAAKLTARNNGIREPEMRLPAMIPFVVIMYLGNIVVSVGYQNHWPWQAIVVIGYACAGIQVAAIPAIVSTYAVDSYKPVAGSLFISMTVNKNVWGYGFSKFITPWSEQVGFIPPIMTNASLILVFCLFGILFYFYGKTFRRWSKDSNVHRM